MRHGLLRLFLATWTGCLCVGGHAAAQEPSTQTAVGQALQLADAEAPVTPEALLDLLAPAGPETVPLFVESIRQLDAETSTRFASALALVPEVALSRVTREDRDVRVELDEARFVVSIGRELGEAAHVSSLLKIASPRPGRSLDRQLEREVRTALESLFERDLEGVDVAGRHHGRVSDALYPAMIRAVGSTRTSAGLRVLLDWLGSDSENAVSILGQISRTAAVVPAMTDANLFRVRALLAAPSDALRREAALAVGRLEDFEAIPTLVELTRDESGGVRDNAEWSLQQLTGLSIHPSRWQRWYQAEYAWWRDAAPELLNTLSLGNEIEVAGAINEIARHRLFRRELARELTISLRHENATIVRLACTALESLKASNTLPELIEVLAHPEEQVRAQACRALRTITGKPLDCTYDAWSSLLL